MATNTTDVTAGHRLSEEALRPMRLEPEHTAERLSATGANGAPATRSAPPEAETAKQGASGPAESGQEFALLPLVDKIAYGFASSLIVAMRELEKHIAGETQKVNDSVNRNLGALQASFQELTEALSEQRSLNVAVQEKCLELEAITVTLRETDERQDSELNAIRSEAAALATSVTERFELSESACKERLAATTATLQEADVRNASDLSSVSASISERVENLTKELTLQQDDMAAVKDTLTGFSSAMDGFAERLDRQAEALRSMFAAYSQRETQLEQLVDGLTRLRANPAPPAARL
jgi:chromosome segregation ATPase